MAAAPKAKKEKDAGSAESGSKKKLFLMIGIAVALIVISIGGTVVALKFLSPAPPAGEAGAAETEEHAASSLVPAIYYEMKPNFTINFNVNGRQRYLQAAITLLYRDPLLEELLKLHMPAIRNGLVMLLSAKNFDELQTNEGKEILREEALEIIRSQLQKEQAALVAQGKADKVSTANIEQVLFTNFVMQ